MKNKKTDTTSQPIILFFGLMLLAWLFGTPKIQLKEGKHAPNPPIQTPTTTPTFTHEDYTITPMAEFFCRAKLLSSKTYSDDWSDICPIDYALGWQQASDEKILRYIHFSQRRRWTYVRGRSLPKEFGNLQDISHQYSNMHLCPATPEIKKALLNAPIGGIVEFSGKLITLTHNKTKRTYKSSTSRTDVRGGACEIVWVESFKFIKNIDK